MRPFFDLPVDRNFYGTRDGRGCPNCGTTSNIRDECGAHRYCRMCDRWFDIDEVVSDA